MVEFTLYQDAFSFPESFGEESVMASAKAIKTHECIVTLFMATLPAVFQLDYDAAFVYILRRTQKTLSIIDISSD